ncbi:hypothetical protein R1sor_025469 [Riccia sorocarpa]|uniref:Uncharacterized protein n=1 Tax=Riccia sorocarpa TaxID=122646 RepID=A0ABD3GCD2_9MARC
MIRCGSFFKDPWFLSLNLDELRAECKARSGNARVFRVPSYIRKLKPHCYDANILHMGMYQRDFRKRTPIDNLQLEILCAFLEHLEVDHNGWSSFCSEVANSEDQVSGSGAPVLEHFYQADARPSFVTLDLQLSVLITDAFFIVAMFIWMIHRLAPHQFLRYPPPLTGQIKDIFCRAGLGCHFDVFTHDIFWVYEVQVPLFLVENLWAKVFESSPAQEGWWTGRSGFGDVITCYLSNCLLTSGLPYEIGDGDIQYSGCDHLLACLHRALCSEPSVDRDRATGRFTRYILKVPIVRQLLKFAEWLGHRMGPYRTNNGFFRIRKVPVVRQLLKFTKWVFDRVEAPSRAKDGLSTTINITKGTLPSASYLHKTGIRFKGVDGNIGGIQFVKPFFGLKATLELPRMAFDDYSGKKLLNLCAYEYMNVGVSTRGLLSFVLFMDELIDSEEDVALLRHGDAPVICYNCLGDNKELADLFANLLQNFSLESDERLVRIRTEITCWSNKWWRRHSNRFLDRFSRAPWLLGSLIAATILLVLSLLQTFYTMWGFYKQY